MQPVRLAWEHVLDGSIISVAATPNFSTICAVTVGKSVYLFDDTGRRLWEKIGRFDHEAWSTAISADGQFVAIGTANKIPSDGTLYVLTRDGADYWSTRIRAPIWSVSLSSNGEVLAASTWKNVLHIFRREGATYKEIAQKRLPGSGGLYGVEVAPNGQLCLAASYDKGLYLVEQSGDIAAKWEAEHGLYNVSVAWGVDTAVVGARNGSFLVAKLGQEEIHTRLSSPLSQRPICGIASVGNGILVAAGSFDGRIILSNDQGGILWDYQTKGEVWSIAISSDGTAITAGSGDHRLRVFRNRCGTSAYEEIQALEKNLIEASVSSAGATLASLIPLYLKYELATYGYSMISGLMENHPEPHVLKGELKRFLAATLERGGGAYSHFHAAEMLEQEKKYAEAIRHLQIAAREPRLRSVAQRKIAEFFGEIQLATAATSAWRQSREQYLDDEALQILYMLARCYEDSGEWLEAAKIFETIISWDADFRNSSERLDIARRLAAGLYPGRDVARRDYTGITASLLGEVPAHGIDAALRGVLQARSRELDIKPGEKDNVQAVVKELAADKDFSRGIRRDFSQLGYDAELFMKYDFGLPEDEMKKFLETVNAKSLFPVLLGTGTRARSLDIGSATGRYPMLLKRIGFEAYGIDIEEAAVTYSRKKVGDEEWPKFFCGDARELERHLPVGMNFNLITCMMGTFDHIPCEDQQALVRKIYEKLDLDGVVIISVWDVECQHLAYLSMYDEVQKENIRRNSRTQEEMRKLFSSAGLVDVIMVPFCLLPQSAVYDLGIERMKAEDIGIAAQADLAARAMFRDRHGEMFLAVGYRREG